MKFGSFFCCCCYFYFFGNGTWIFLLFFFEISFDALPRGKIVNGRLECKQDVKQAVTACEQSTQSQKLGAFIYIYILSLLVSIYSAAVLT